MAGTYLWPSARNIPLKITPPLPSVSDCVARSGTVSARRQSETPVLGFARVNGIGLGVDVTIPSPVSEAAVTLSGGGPHRARRDQPE